MPEKPFKATVTIERRPDGGLRVWSDDLPGLVLSHTNEDMVFADLPIAVKEMFGVLENAR